MPERNLVRRNSLSILIIGTISLLAGAGCSKLRSGGLTSDLTPPSQAAFANQDLATQQAEARTESARNYIGQKVDTTRQPEARIVGAFESDPDQPLVKLNASTGPLPPAPSIASASLDPEAWVAGAKVKREPQASDAKSKEDPAVSDGTSQVLVAQIASSQRQLAGDESRVISASAQSEVANCEHDGQCDCHRDPVPPKLDPVDVATAELASEQTNAEAGRDSEQTHDEQTQFGAKTGTPSPGSPVAQATSTTAQATTLPSIEINRLRAVSSDASSRTPSVFHPLRPLRVTADENSISQQTGAPVVDSVALEPKVNEIVASPQVAPIDALLASGKVPASTDNSPADSDSTPPARNSGNLSNITVGVLPEIAPTQTHSSISVPDAGFVRNAAPSQPDQPLDLADKIESDPSLETVEQAQQHGSEFELDSVNRQQPNCATTDLNAVGLLLADGQPPERQTASPINAEPTPFSQPQNPATIDHEANGFEVPTESQFDRQPASTSDDPGQENALPDVGAASIESNEFQPAAQPQMITTPEIIVQDEPEDELAVPVEQPSDTDPFEAAELTGQTTVESTEQAPAQPLPQAGTSQGIFHPKDNRPESLPDLEQIEQAFAGMISTLPAASPAVADAPIPDLSTQLQRTISQVKTELADAPDSASRNGLEVNLRLLEMLQRQTTSLDQQHRMINNDQKRSLQHQLDALAKMLMEGESQSINTNDETLASLKAAVQELESLADLRVGNGRLCTKIIGFGNFRTFPDSTFSGDQRMLVYCEIENQTSLPINEVNGTTRYRTRLKGSLAIYDDQGNVVQQQEFPIIEDRAHKRRRDFYVYFPIQLQQLKPGDHRMELMIEDVDGSKTATLKPAIQFSVSPD